MPVNVFLSTVMLSICVVVHVNLIRVVCFHIYLTTNKLLRCGEVGKTLNVSLIVLNVFAHPATSLEMINVSPEDKVGGSFGLARAESCFVHLEADRFCWPFLRGASITVYAQF